MLAVFDEGSCGGQTEGVPFFENLQHGTVSGEEIVLGAVQSGLVKARPQALEILERISRAEEFLRRGVTVNSLVHLAGAVPEGRHYSHNDIHENRLRRLHFRSFEGDGVDVHDVSELLPLREILDVDCAVLPFEAAGECICLHQDGQLENLLLHLILFHQTLRQFYVGLLHSLHSNIVLRTPESVVDNAAKNEIVHFLVNLRQGSNFGVVI